MSGAVHWRALVEAAEADLLTATEVYRIRPTAHRREAVDEARRALDDVRQLETLDASPSFRATVRSLIASVRHA